jgi:hypothetical protein
VDTSEKPNEMEPSEKPCILTWLMPMEPIGGAPRDYLAVAMTEDGYLLASTITSKHNNPPYVGSRGEHIDRFERRFPDGYRVLGIVDFQDERIKAAIDKNRALGPDGDIRL